jgi:hypothetical protein
MSGVVLPDGVPVVISPYLPPLEVRTIDGKIYAGSQAAIERVVAEANRWVLLRTVPPTAMNRETGELIDLPEPPAERCRLCGGWHG